MRVLTVPASAPFLTTVITALVDGRLVSGFTARQQPDRLADATLYLPTRRAGRMARDIFLDVLGTDAAILPRIVTLGAIDEDELAFSDEGQQIGRDALEIPPELSDLDRRLTLARMVGAWAARLTPETPDAAPLLAGGPAATLRLAGDLARLMDDMVTRKVDWRALDTLVPDEFDVYWQLTLGFLRIAREMWPAHLAEIGRIEPAERRDRLIDAEAVRLASYRGPVIAAGSTGSMPATARLLQSIAALPQGAVVLPGLDTDLDEAAWQAIDGGEADGGGVEHPASNHPQFALHALLERMGLRRDDVVTLGQRAPWGREILLSEAMRPASATSRWHTRLKETGVETAIAAGMSGFSVIAAPNSEIEALAIAVAMREAREQNLTAVLVTPDRALARRVGTALGRWNLVVKDSAGVALRDTTAGIFARLAAGAAVAGLEPATLLALLKHPLFRLGRAEGGWRKAAEVLELALLRGTRPEPGSEGLAREFERFRALWANRDSGDLAALHRSDPRARLAAWEIDQAAALIAALRAALAPLEAAKATADLSMFAERHRAVIDALSTDADGIALAFVGDDGEALDTAFEDMPCRMREGAEVVAATGLVVPPSDYPDSFDAAFGDRPVRFHEAGQAQLQIYGPLEARLTQCDRVILGGLIEGVWPPAPPIDPWLSRPMRHQLGLDLPERRIGLSAHDFAQLMGAREVIVSHAAKSGGAPAVASRFLHRLEAVAGEARWEAACAAGDRYLQFAAALDQPAQVQPAPQPTPSPPRGVRPTKLPVTAIEDWLRDPYTIFAKYILRLSPLDPVDMPPSAADRGSAIHAALGDFSDMFATSLPSDPAGALREIGQRRFAPLMSRPEARALWWPRFLRIATWFADWEIARRPAIAQIIAERQGELAIPLADHGQFTLTARADRIERHNDGTYAIVDYKTGQPPTAKQVRLGLSPQLTLEAAILRAGGFDGVPAMASVAELTYVKLSGNEPAGESEALELKKSARDQAQSPDDAAAEALGKLEEFIRKFDNDHEPFRSLVLPMWTNRYGTYDDLARIKEWSAAGLGGDGGGDE